MEIRDTLNGEITIERPNTVNCQLFTKINL